MAVPAPGSLPTSGAGPIAPHKPSLAVLTLGALGVVYGDIGTSPLYAIKECFAGDYGLAPTHENVLGVLSLVFWALTAGRRRSSTSRSSCAPTTAAKAASSRCWRCCAPPRGRMSRLITLGLFGAALLYGDGVITPAISVLSAVGGPRGRDAGAGAVGACRSRSPS